MSVTLVYADWCGHCKKLKPTWNKVKAQFGDVKVTELNADKDQQKIKALGVDGFPTIFYEKNGEKVDYDGDRSESSLVKFFKDASGSQGGGGNRRRQRGGADAQVYQNLSIVTAVISAYLYFLSIQ